MLKRTVVFVIILGFIFYPPNSEASAPYAFRSFFRNVPRFLKDNIRKIDWQTVGEKAYEELVNLLEEAWKSGGTNPFEEIQKIIEHIKEQLEKFGDRESNGLYTHIRDCRLCSNLVGLANNLPTGEFRAIWVDHNFYDSGRKGMRIHVKFDVANLRGVECGVAAYFYFNSGQRLNDYNGSYCTSDGQVSVGTKFTPLYENTTFSDVTMFTPYDELHMSSGIHELKFKVDLYKTARNDHFAISNFEYFRYESY